MSERTTVLPSSLFFPASSSHCPILHFLTPIFLPKHHRASPKQNELVVPGLTRLSLPILNHPLLQYSGLLHTSRCEVGSFPLELSCGAAFLWQVFGPSLLCAWAQFCLQLSTVLS